MRTLSNYNIMTLSEFIKSKTVEFSDAIFIHTFANNILEITEYNYQRGGGAPIPTGFTRYKLELNKTNDVLQSTKL